MKLLLDTHVFIWSVLEPEKLSSQIVMLISSDDNDLFFSTASIWEMQIKIGIGKLHFDNLLSEIVAQQREINELKILPIKLKHIWQLNNLPLHHKDPFDRMIISQAITENLPILTIDNIFAQYPINTIW